MCACCLTPKFLHLFGRKVKLPRNQLMWLVEKKKRIFPLHWFVPHLACIFWFNHCAFALTCCVSLLTHLLCVCTFPLFSLQSWQLLSPKLPCGLCFISSSLQDLLSTSLLCSQLLSTPTKVRPPPCLSPSATQTNFFLFLPPPQVNWVYHLKSFQID